MVILLPNSTKEIESNKIWEVAKNIEAALKQFQKLVVKNTIDLTLVIR
jgi:hypothetical protein